MTTTVHPPPPHPTQQQPRKMSQQRDLFQELESSDPFALPLGSFAADDDDEDENSPVRGEEGGGLEPPPAWRRRSGDDVGPGEGRRGVGRALSPPLPLRHDTHHHHPYRQPSVPLPPLPHGWGQGPGYQYTFGHQQPTPFSWGPGQYPPTMGERGSAAGPYHHGPVPAPPGIKQDHHLPPTLRGSPPMQQRSGRESSPVKDAASSTSKDARILFRSPTAPSQSKQFDRSALYQASPPAIGTYGSFGMDTPQGGMMGDDLSPMEPGFEESFTRDTSFLPHPPRFQPHESPVPSEYWPPYLGAAQRGGEASSAKFMRSFSPMAPSGVSHIAQSHYDRSAAHAPPPMYHPPPTTEHYPFTRPAPPLRVGHLAPPAPPPAVQSPARRQLYVEPSPKPPPSSAMRLELRNQPSSTQKALAGINSKMQQAQRQQAPTMPYGQSPHVPYRRHPTPPHVVTSPVPHPASSRAQPHLAAASSRHPILRDSPILTRPPYRSNDAELPAHESGGKENTATIRPPEPIDPSRPGRCNCKKSRCLKLYCECFAAEIFCFGCKCRDCRNIPAFAHARDRAMVDIKSKNPEAFKPRVEAAHNMGCK